LENKPPRWLEWAREIQALSQTGYHYSENEYNRERYQRLTEIAAEIVAEYSQESGDTKIDYSPLVKAFSAQIGYATPRVDVRGVVFNEGKLLLVRERMDGGWTFPGGWAEVGDAPSEAVEREVWEEAGFRVKARKVVGVYDANRLEPLDIFHAYKIVFLCEIIDGEPRPSAETSEVAFFELDEIPQTLSGERTKTRHIQDVLESCKDPDIPTFFD
jgi:ADP-ribose pyrophosphatase YjhB (NUDIX family)